jgi:septum formation protein
MRLILASVSPRRRELLQQSGIEYEGLPVSADELPRVDETPEALALRLAREKARLAFERLEGRAGLILSADTIVADGGQALGKPRDKRQAEEYLLQLRGRTHRVITAVCLLRSPGGEEATDIAVTEVRMRDYSRLEISEYVAGGDPLDKAGAYAIQHAAFRPVESIAGCYTNVVGLPLCRVFSLLEGAGEKPDRALPGGCLAGGLCGFAPFPDRMVRRVTF